MNINKKLVVGIMLFVLTAVLAVPMQVLAYTPQQVNANRANGKYAFTNKSAEVITMQVAGDTLRFQLEKNPTGALATAAASNYIYILQGDTNDGCRVGFIGGSSTSSATAQIRVPKTNIDNNPGNQINGRLIFFTKNADSQRCTDTNIEPEINIKNSFGQELKVSGVQGGTGGTADEGVACDVALLNPLSWILCPLIELGANFTDYVFSSIVKPLLEEVPISTNPNDPGYKAWNQFRIIGNLVLVGTMLAVVYAQVRGDK